MPRKTDELYGYNMGTAIDEVIMSLNEMEDEYNALIAKLPTDPREWARLVGRLQQKRKEAQLAMRYIKKTFDENKKRNGD